MRFASPQFLGFFLTVFCLHWLAPRRWRNPVLLAASYLFYASWSLTGAGLLLLVTAASYLFARAASAAAPGRRARWVWTAVAFHVGVLAFFKCGNFGLANWTLPLGLSYATFIALGYVLDVSRGFPAAESFLPYCLFVGFFPQITAGPISRARSLLPQLESDRRFDAARFSEGCHLIIWGLFQKVVVADNLSLVTGSVFDGGVPKSGLTALIGIYSFTLQLYGDFAGYSNIARGLAKCLGLELAENFRLPFFAQDMQEHWKRWHISLSEWFADFVYRPLVDLPLGYYKFFAAPMATMLVMGLWHRPSLQMAVLGLNYGFWISLTIFVKSWALGRKLELGPAARAVLPWINRLVTFHLVCGGFILLRAHSLAQAGGLAARAFGGGPYFVSDRTAALAARLAVFGGPLLAFEAVEYVRGGAGSLQRLPVPLRAALYAGLAALLFSFGRWRAQNFFYAAF